MKIISFCIGLLSLAPSHAQSKLFDVLVITSDHSYNNGYTSNIGIGGMQIKGYFEHVYTYSAGASISLVENKKLLGPYFQFQYAPINLGVKRTLIPTAQVWIWAPSDFQNMSLKISPTIGVSVASIFYISAGYNFNATRDNFSSIGNFRCAVGLHYPIDFW